MNTAFEDQLRDVLRAAPEPDWHAMRSAVDERAGRKRRARMLRATLSGAAAAAAVATIAVGAANSSMFEGQKASPASSGSATPSASASSDVPVSTAFQPRVKTGERSDLMPMVFPDVAPKGSQVPSGLVLSWDKGEMSRDTASPAFSCLDTPQAPAPQPWGSADWSYGPAGTPDVAPEAGVRLIGWPSTTAVPAMNQMADNSGACTFDRHFRQVAWPGHAASEANQFVVKEAEPPTPPAPVVTLRPEPTSLAVRRVGDVTVHGWTRGGDAAALAEARRLVDETVANLLASKVLDAPKQEEVTWQTFAMPDAPAEFVLPALEPTAESSGVRELKALVGTQRSLISSPPVMGAQAADPAHAGSRILAGRTQDYEITGGQSAPMTTYVRTTAFADGRKAFDEIVADRGTARWVGGVTRDEWAGHDESTTFLAVHGGQPNPSQIALRLEGNVLISVVAQGETQAQARTIATKLADEAAKNLASFGRGPDGRPGNGK